MATCKLCPMRKYCWDKGNCEECPYAKAFEGLNKKIDKLKKQNETLKSENEKLKYRISVLENPNF